MKDIDYNVNNIELKLWHARFSLLLQSKSSKIHRKYQY